jgi:hypothetical protein
MIVADICLKHGLNSIYKEAVVLSVRWIPFDPMIMRLFRHRPSLRNDVLREIVTTWISFRAQGQ